MPRLFDWKKSVPIASGLQASFAVEQDIRFSFLACMPVDIRIQASDIESGIQIKQERAGIIVLAFQIDPTVSTLCCSFPGSGRRARHTPR